MDNDPFDVNILPGCRKLTDQEKQSMLKAIQWLHKRGIPYKNVVRLCQSSIDREGKTVFFELETKRFIIKRAVPYADSPLDTYLTEVLPCLKVKPVAFPHSAGTGRKEVFGFNVKADKIEAYFSRKREQKHLKMLRICVIMKPSRQGIVH